MDDVGLPAQLEAAGVVVAGIADLVVSNGVFNLCVDKRQAFLNVRILIKCSTYSDFVLQMYLGTNFFFLENFGRPLHSSSLVVSLS